MYMNSWDGSSFIKSLMLVFRWSQPFLLNLHREFDIPNGKPATFGNLFRMAMAHRLFSVKIYGRRDFFRILIRMSVRIREVLRLSVNVLDRPGEVF